MDRHFALPSDPDEALGALRSTSDDAPVLVFKRSPICPTSFAAEHRLRQFLEALDPACSLRVAMVDVIEERPLARGLTALLGIQHESPQALWFRAGDLTWHASHGAITEQALQEQLA